MPDELKHEIAEQVAGLLWSAPASETTEDAHTSETERTDLTDDQRAAIRLIASALPRYWQSRIMALLDGGGDSSDGVLVAA